MATSASEMPAMTTATPPAWLPGEVVERLDDAEDGAEQADERRVVAERAEEGEVALEAHALAAPSGPTIASATASTPRSTSSRPAAIDGHLDGVGPSPARAHRRRCPWPAGAADRSASASTSMRCVSEEPGALDHDGEADDERPMSSHSTHVGAEEREGEKAFRNVHEVPSLSGLASESSGKCMPQEYDAQRGAFVARPGF